MFEEESVSAGIPEELRKPYLAAVEEGNAVWEKGLAEAKAAVFSLHLQTPSSPAE